MEAGAAVGHPAGARSLGRALAGPRAQERPRCPAPGGGSKAEARVLVINTGGTIGMVQDDKGEGAAEGAGPRRGPQQGALETGPCVGCGRAQRRGMHRLFQAETAASLTEQPCFVAALPGGVCGSASSSFSYLIRATPEGCVPASNPQFLPAGYFGGLVDRHPSDK